MVISISQQAMLVLFSLISGILTGVFFDVYRLVRGIETPSKIVTFIQDILFWILTALVVFIFLSIYDYAYIGVYVYLWIAIGSAIYFLFLSRPFIIILHRIIDALGKILRVFKNLICLPFEVIIYYAARKEKKFKKKLEENSKSI